ncbi:hypothetical protein E5161_01280 [Cohnella pontilimi]|uniref:Uncharacterized protein n=1 Tax=Cohnella pontilimi TaxID=2564100 RepID=A0A4U0FGM7_9BACL|nr:hypothetical protein [Cohnella pontilimi]TJY44058.1 hypothetical protein E5161_01280 [Cohnella pontilimi]
MTGTVWIPARKTIRNAVMNPFRRKKPNRDITLAEDVRAQYQSLETRFRRLEESLETIKSKFPQVTIEHVHIHQPVLENLEFRLDGLDIEHLSGSLNLGNNFGTKISPQSTATVEKKVSKEPASEPGITRTPSGFRLNNRR